MANMTYNPKPGIQQPNKYPFTGPNYAQYGEQQGYIYYPYTDSYYVDPNTVQTMYEEQGVIKKPKEQGLTDVLLPVAAVTGGTALASEGAKEAVGGISSLIKGGSAATSAAEAATAAAPATTTTTAAPNIVSANFVPSVGEAGATSGLGGIGIGPMAGIAAATYLGGNEAINLMRGKSPNWGDAGIKDKAGRVILGMATGGLSEVARPFINRESTKEAQQRRWGSLLSNADEGKKDLVGAAYQANHPEGDTGVWQSGKYAGQKWTFEKAKDLAKDDPSHFQHVYGNISLAGDRWFDLTDEQQKQFVKLNLDNNNYDSKKGDVIIKDHDLGLKLLDQVRNGTTEPPKREEAQPQTRPAQGSIFNQAQDIGAGAGNGTLEQIFAQLKGK